LIIPFFPVLFASTYFLMERDSAASFGQPLTRTDALYFTVTADRTAGALAKVNSPSSRTVVAPLSRSGAVSMATDIANSPRPGNSRRRRVRRS
jgi:hypothetical protein